MQQINKNYFSITFRNMLHDQMLNGTDKHTHTHTHTHTQLCNDKNLFAKLTGGGGGGGGRRIKYNIRVMHTLHQCKTYIAVYHQQNLFLSCQSIHVCVLLTPILMKKKTTATTKSINKKMMKLWSNVLSHGRFWTRISLPPKSWLLCINLGSYSPSG